MEFLTTVKQRYCIVADKWKGAKWVKPTFNEWYQELKAEEGELFDVLLDNDAHKSIYKKAYVMKLTPRQAKKIEISEGGIPPITFLTDPEEKPDFEHDTEFRYSSRHHKDMLPRMRMRKSLTMPSVFSVGKTLYAIGGRHRIAYSIALKLPLEVFVFQFKDVLKIDPNALKGRFS